MGIIIGNGQLANVFNNINLDSTIIFASGVSNSNCKDINEFNREKDLLKYHLLENQNSKLVYFSCCALSSSSYPKNAYYQHKSQMEEIIKDHTSNYYIFRLPQVFGKLQQHNTLINYFYYSIINNNVFNVYSDAYRYVIDINDVKKLVNAYVNFSNPCITVDLANTFRYDVLDIINTLEIILNKKARFNIIDKHDGYLLDLSDMNSFISSHDIEIGFGQNYLRRKLQEELELATIL